MIPLGLAPGIMSTTLKSFSRYHLKCTILTLQMQKKEVTG